MKFHVQKLIYAGSDSCRGYRVEPSGAGSTRSHPPLEPPWTEEQVRLFQAWLVQSGINTQCTPRGLYLDDEKQLEWFMLKWS